MTIETLQLNFQFLSLTEVQIKTLLLLKTTIQLITQEMIQVMIQVMNQLMYHKYRHSYNQVMQPETYQHILQANIQSGILYTIHVHTQMLSREVSKGKLQGLSQESKPKRNNHIHSRFKAGVMSIREGDLFTLTKKILTIYPTRESNSKPRQGSYSVL